MRDVRVVGVGAIRASLSRSVLRFSGVGKGRRRSVVNPVCAAELLEERLVLSATSGPVVDVSQLEITGTHDDSTVLVQVSDDEFIDCHWHSFSGLQRGEVGLDEVGSEANREAFSCFERFSGWASAISTRTWAHLVCPFEFPRPSPTPWHICAHRHPSPPSWQYSNEGCDSESNPWHVSSIDFQNE